MGSLSGRLLLAVSLLLAVFFGITIVLLDRAFRISAETAIRDRLDVQLRVLLAAAEPTDAQPPSLDIADPLPEARFETPGSGLYGQIEAPGGATVWRSPSAVGAGIEGLPRPPPGERRFFRTETLNEEEVFALTLGLEYEFPTGELQPFSFTVAEFMVPFRDEVAGFRRALFGWFALLTIALLASQALLLRLLLRPLRRVQAEIAAIEQGRCQALGEDYPRELRGVTGNLNALLAAERERLARYRDTLGNLAHSLKTPMAVIRNAVSGQADEATPVVREQLDHMQRIVAYQLQRAAAWGATSLGVRPVAVRPLAERLLRSLEKVYAGRGLRFAVDISPGADFFGDEGDLMEVLGNLLDNACKWSRGRVHLRVRPLAAPSGRRRPGLVIEVADDGPGIEAAQAERLTERGVRADERVDGHGIGLHIVREIAQLYGGDLRIGASTVLGGARVEVRFDGR